MMKVDKKALLINKIAKLCYLVNVRYSQFMNSDNFSRELLQDREAVEMTTPKDLKEAVCYVLEHPSVTARDMHNRWVECRKQKGWKYGLFRSEKKKKHPCLVSYEKLKKKDKVKDILFLTIVRTMGSLFLFEEEINHE